MTNEEAIANLEMIRLAFVAPVTNEQRKLIYDTFKMATEALKAQKVGHWIKTPKAVMGEGYMWYCDKCEHQVYQDSSRDYPSENYCPNCGSKNGGNG